MNVKQISRFLVFAVVFTALAAGTARAGERTIMKVNVPFPFLAGHEVMPSGTYNLLAEDGNSVIWVQGAESHPHVAIVFTSTAGGTDPTGDQPTLVFTRDEGQLRLTQIWLSDEEGLDVAYSLRSTAKRSAIR